MITSKYIKRSILLLFLAISIVNCGGNKSKTNKGATIGSIAGAVLGVAVGAVVGGEDGAIIGGAIGGVVGGATGAVVGHKMDQQAKRIEEEIPGVAITKVEETKVINVTFDETNGVYFDTNKYTLNESSRATIKKLAGILTEYSDTDIAVIGHTDNVGKEESNLLLSKNRAQSVADYLISEGIDEKRFTVRYQGEFEPKFSNDTKEGRSKNRRVEIIITPIEKTPKQTQSTMTNKPAMNRPPAQTRSSSQRSPSTHSNGIINF